MAIHKSLRLSATTSGNRSVLKRAERLEKLEKDGRWKRGDKVLGIPKTRVPKVKAKAKKAEKKKDDAAAPAAAAAAPAKK
jgi:small basic protein (TIGR04137 family)